MFFDIGFYRFNAYGTFIIKAYTAIAYETSAMQEVGNHYRLEYIQLKMPRSPADTDRYIITHHLCCNHRMRFTLRRVHFTRHNGRTGFIIGDEQLTYA